MLNNDQVAAEQIFNETRAKVQRHEAEIANKQAQIQAIKASKHKGDAPPNWGAPPSGWVAPPSNSACIITTPATQPHNHHSRAHPRAHAPTPTLLSVVTSTGVPLPDRRPPDRRPPERRPLARRLPGHLPGHPPGRRLSRRRRRSRLAGSRRPLETARCTITTRRLARPHGRFLQCPSRESSGAPAGRRAGRGNWRAWCVATPTLGKSDSRSVAVHCFGNGQAWPGGGAGLGLGMLDGWGP